MFGILHCSKFSLLIKAVSYWEQAYDRHHLRNDSTRGQEEAESGKTPKGAQRLKGQLAKLYGSIPKTNSSTPTPEQIRSAISRKQ